MFAKVGCSSYLLRCESLKKNIKEMRDENNDKLNS